MLEKIKIVNLKNKVALDVGTSLMALATIVGMLELSGHSLNKIALNMQPVYASSHNQNELNNPMRREKEEAGPQYISYSESQRTPSRAGKY